MSDRCNNILFLGQHSFIKQLLERYFLSKSDTLFKQYNKETKQFCPIIIHQTKNDNITNRYLDMTIKVINGIRKETRLPIMLFFINEYQDVSVPKQLKAVSDSIIEMKIEPMEDICDTKIHQMVKQIGKTIESFLSHPPKSDYTITLISPPKHHPKVGVVGLGYVGIPVAVGFAEKFDVIGFDIDQEKINQLTNHVDPTKQILTSTLKETSIEFISHPYKLRECNYIIVTVPTPITVEKKPDLSFLKNASAMIGEHLQPQTIIVYESTVYPGTTEHICIPILEEKSQLTAGKDFYVGYSPERINPGDKTYTFKSIPKIIAGQNKYTVEKIHDIYEQILDAEIYKAPTIQVAEAAKIVENTQRDINIAFMNELSIIFNKLNIEIDEVIEAAKTKWNFMPFSPGLVGGHCIGVDSYYLIYKSMQEGYTPEFLSSAREVNDWMATYIVQSLLQLIISKQINLENLRITVLGITFKENIADIRNSKTLEIIHMLQELKLDVQVHDPHVSSDVVKKQNINLKLWDQLKRTDVVILAVPHEFYKEKTKQEWQSLCKEKGIVMDLKKAIPKNTFTEDITIWTL